MTRHLCLILAAVLLLSGNARADNVDLVTLPSREGVQLTIYNSADLTFVKERRHLTLKRGMNTIQFSWANTLIDPSSVDFRPLEHADKVEVADTVFPGQKPQFLVWHIESRYEGQLLVEVSYFTSGLSWQMDYVGTVDPEEERMDLRGHVRVVNRSGEEYENAEIRLIVGTINLVEKIADLARRRGIPRPQPGSPVALRLRRDGAKAAFDQAAMAEGLRAQGKSVVKEGFSEYFMFSVEGTETIGNGWSKRMQAVHAKDTSFDIVYRMRAHQYGARPVRFFVWRNDEEHELGDAPLPNGRIRLFRENGREGLSYLGDQLLRYVPIKAPIEVNVGTDDLVVYESLRQGTERFNFSFRHGRVVGWDTKTRWVDQVRNYRGKPIHFELRRRWSGHVDYTSPQETSTFDHQTIQAAFTVAPRGRALYRATVVQHEGHNARQNRIDLR